MQQVSHPNGLAAGQPRAFTAWRPVDDLILTAMAHSRSRIDDMAERLGRTPAEVATQLERLDLG